MGISLENYRAAIGSWHLTRLSRRPKSPKNPLTPIKIKVLLGLLLNSYGIFIGILLILRSGDVHPHPGPVTYEQKNLSICHVNVQSLYLRIGYHRRKIDEIHTALVNDAKIDIICLSETWLDNNINDDDLKIPGYTIRRKDRTYNYAGGAGMYIADAITHRRAYELEFPEIDLLWIELKLDQKKIFVGACYRPPGQSLEDKELFISKLSDSLDLVYLQKPESIFLMGDLNDSCSVWESDHNKSELGLRLYDLINTHDLHQMVREPTHIKGRAANILDLLITDSPGYIINQNQDTLPPIGSIHQIVYAEISIQYKRDKPYLREVWSYKRGDYVGLLEDLRHVQWDADLNHQNNINELADHWQESFMNVCRQKIPNCTIRVKPMDKPWFNHEVKIAIRRRNRLYKRFKRSRLPAHENAWKISAIEANFFMNKAKNEHKEKIKNILMTTKIGEKKYWQIAKQVYGTKKIIGIPSLKINDETITTSKEKADHFTEYFAAQQTLPPIPFNHALPPIIFLSDQRLSHIETNRDEVLKILKSLDTGKANGPDGISNKLLKEASTEIATSLSNLFNSSFELSKVPIKWKESNICPIHKKDDKSLVTNYRPISLLSCVGKVQERIVYIHLYRFLKQNNLLTWKNSGFKELDSAMNQLLFITDKIHKALEEGKEICLVFLDVSKAFDRVWHSGLLHKLRCLGIEGNLFDWLCDYLADRKIRTVINGQKSTWQNTTAGVPQGSILGPLLFLVFINDITTNIECDIHLFADDTSLMDVIDNYIVSYAKLNRDLNRLATWATKWMVTFNAKKTVYLQVSRKLNPAPKPILRLNGVVINEVQTHKHLGLTFNNTLTWTDHISQLVTKASRCIGLLRRIGRDVPRQCLELLYKSMIRPIMEYADVIFDGSSDTSLKRLEDTQRQAALACTGAYKHTRHDNLLEELGWSPLATRRRHHRMNLMFKIQHGITPPYLTELCPPLTRDRTEYNLRTGMNITIPAQRTTTYHKSFFPQSINDWNNMDIQTRNSPSIENFKDKQKSTSSHKSNPLFHHNSNNAAINQTRMRLGLSALSSHRHDYNHINDPRCMSCNGKIEDPIHYFLICPTYAPARPPLMLSTCNIISKYPIDIDFTNRQFCIFFVDTLLKGSTMITLDDNKSIMKTCQAFIRESHRFP
jgi:hypothetical protein